MNADVQPSSVTLKVEEAKHPTNPTKASGLAGLGVSPGNSVSLHRRTTIEAVLGQTQVDARGWPRAQMALVRSAPLRIAAMHLEILIALIIACSVASAWRGAWLILDAAFLPEQPVVSAAVSLAIGSGLLWLATVVQPCLFAAVRLRPSHMSWILDAAFSYVGFWCSVFVWRGMWQLWDHALGVGFAPAPRNLELERSGWLSHAVGVVVLFFTDALRSLNAPPMIYVSDSGPPLFGARTSPSWDGLLRLDRYLRPPVLPKNANEWRAAVGLPPVHENDDNRFF